MEKDHKEKTPLALELTTCFLLLCVNFAAFLLVCGQAG